MNGGKHIKQVKIERYKLKNKPVIKPFGHLLAPYLITKTLRCKGGRYFFPWVAPITLDPYVITLSVKQGGIK